MLTVVIATAIVVAAVLGAAFIGATVVQHRRYRRVSEHFAGRLLAVQDEERAAISRELHDDVVQRMVALTAELRAQPGPPIDSIALRLDRLTEALRGLARGMHPTVVDHVGIGDALQQLVTAVGEREGLTIELRNDLATDTLQPRQRLALYRVAQEALGNAARHAEVDHVSVVLAADRGQVKLVIDDRGRGFGLDDAAAGPGIGLTSMRERLSALGGSVTVDTSRGHGTTVTAMVPTGAPP